MGSAPWLSVERTGRRRHGWERTLSAVPAQSGSGIEVRPAPRLSSPQPRHIHGERIRALYAAVLNRLLQGP
jgi:hypothetical protein